MEHCPVCKEPMPALSKICPVCGYIATQNDNTDNLLDTLVDKMENCLHNLKNLPRPTIMYGIKNNLLILYIILVVQFFILAAVSMSTVAWIIVFIFMILSILAIRNKFRNKGNETSRQLEQIINEYETYQRQANTYFGKDKEVKNLSQTLTQELDAIRKERKKQTFRYNLSGLLLILGISFITGFAIFSLSKFIATSELPIEESSVTEYLNRGDYDKAIAIYPEIENKSIDEGEISRSRIIDKLCQNQQWEKASSFFFRYSIGKRGDYACAQTIIKELQKDNRPDEAADFLEACTSLSYPSDFNKLKKLIYK